VLRALARRIQAATNEAQTVEREILNHARALVPDLLNERGVGPIVAAQLIVTWSHHDRIDSEACFAGSPASLRCQPPAARPPATGSAAAATANSTALSTQSSFTAANTTPQPATTSPAASPKAKADATPLASSSDTSPATSTASCRTPLRQPLDSHRSFIREHWSSELNSRRPRGLVEDDHEFALVVAFCGVGCWRPINIQRPGHSHASGASSIGPVS
jgi:hypothetical protein